MEQKTTQERLKIKNKAQPLFDGITLTGGCFQQAQKNNIQFLKGFDVDRMLYWFRVNAGEPAPSAPYGFGGGHFENNLHGQTAGQFLMGAGTALLWTEDEELRLRVNTMVDALETYIREDGCLLPVKPDDVYSKEYPNYVRAWLMFGLLAAGYAGNEKAFALARRFGDWFNTSECLPYVKDLNLGFQGIVPCTDLYLSPVGVPRDVAVAQQYFREDWWLSWLDHNDSKAIYAHPGNHPHGTILTTLESYLDLYRITGEEYLLHCVKKALRMVEESFQHVGGGIAMCEDFSFNPAYPGSNFLFVSHSYNELCCSTFWILLNQRMHLLFPDEVHYADEIEKSVYNVLLACQEGDKGYHYFAYLDGAKDAAFTDRATCCAGTGGRLMSQLPQLMAMHTADTVTLDLYASADIDIDGTRFSVQTDMPYDGKVRIDLHSWNHRYLKLRIPSWCGESVTVGGKTAVPGSYLTLDALSTGMTLEFELPFAVRVTKYTGADEAPHRTRYALEVGPLLLAALQRGDVTLKYDVAHPALEKCGKGRYRLKGDWQPELRAYMDISDEPFTVYPYVVAP